MSKISIIIPIYNKESSIKECIDSVCTQSFTDIEIICVDDGSTDKSVDVLSKAMQNEKRIKLISQHNQGSGAARNAGIKAATGEYIAFLDADDLYPSNSILATLYLKAVTNDANICGGGLEIWDGKEVTTTFPKELAGFTFEKEGWIDYREYQFDYGYYRFIYRREFLISHQLFFPDYRRYQDPPFMLRAFDCAKRFYAIPDVTYRYQPSRIHLNWTSEKVMDLLCAIEDNLQYAADHSYYNIYALNYYRLCNDFCDIIVNTAIHLDWEGRILDQLLSIQSKTNADILLASNLFSQREIACSKPLEELLSRLVAQNTQIKQEGWYINKKIFRIATWPIRCACKLAGKLRDVFRNIRMH